MDVFRRKTYTRLTKAVVIVLSMLLMQMLGAALVHVSLTEHTYCASHQAFEHADEDGDTLEHDAHASLSAPAHAPSDDSDTSGESCDYLTWLQGPTVPLPELHASLLNLPPPAESVAARPLTAQAHVPSPIDLLRLSPGHSPPVGTHLSA